jgi:nucleoside-diphosphate-sugar epimerase
MKLAILGATSQIAKDFILSCARTGTAELSLFARNPHAVNTWLAQQGLANRYPVSTFDNFAETIGFDVLINFVGAGDPAKVIELGSNILALTQHYDDLALAYLQRHPGCRYFFLSSGAVYGGAFVTPASVETQSVVPINQIKPEHWYAIAKLLAECRHRAADQLAIVDLRVFGYFSRSHDPDARYLMSDIVRALREEKPLRTTTSNIIRDYLHPNDFAQLIFCLLDAEPTNIALDVYSGAPVEKLALLASLATQFGLHYTTEAPHGPLRNDKLCYYSLDRRADQFGYRPDHTSLSGILEELAVILGH